MIPPNALERIVPLSNSTDCGRWHPILPSPRGMVHGCALLLGCLFSFDFNLLASGQGPATDGACSIIERVLPPVGLAPPESDVQRWLGRLNEIESACRALPEQRRPDVDILTKACRLAIEFQEFYQPRDFAKMDRLLELAHARTQQLATQTDWQSDVGRQIRGFLSAVDGSPQPVGLILPAGWAQASSKLPMVVWLHGRGDKQTDLHWLCERLDKDGEVVPVGTIVLHAFGRQCVGYKSAGETDVLEAIQFVCDHYPVDEQKIVLMGFSMGGAGVWHLAAHYADRFVAASPGAGFAETARYQNLQPDKFPPLYEQILWSVYDVPGYTRNLFNMNLVAYSGEMDKQIQAARVMEEAFQAEGSSLTHLIGPGMGHKYHPETLREILKRMEDTVRQPLAVPGQLWLQTRHPRYASRRWIQVDGFQQQYADTRVEASGGPSAWSLTTRNVSRLELNLNDPHAPRGSWVLDGQRMNSTSNTSMVKLVRNADQWTAVDHFEPIRKRARLSGPIDDAFIDPFLVVLPSQRSPYPEVQKWVDCESRHFLQRWKGLFRGAARVKLDRDVTDEDMQRYHLVLWGDNHSNLLLNRILTEAADYRLPLRMESQQWVLGEHRWAANANVPLMIAPNPHATNRYVVINSGPTFREAHDRTNSLQNPHLPDWAVISLDQPPNATAPGRLLKAGFFDDRWQFDAKLQW